MEIGRICNCGNPADSLSVMLTWKLGGFAIMEIQRIPCLSYSHGNWEDLQLWKSREFVVTTLFTWTFGGFAIVEFRRFTIGPYSHGNWED